MDMDRRHLPLLLPDHHRRLDAQCQALLECAYVDDAPGLVQRWRGLEPELLEHMAQEDEVILADYAEVEPDDARRIRAEHTQLRALIAIVGADIARGEVRCVWLRELASVLRNHARHEDKRMYPWAQRHLTQGTARSLFVRVCEWFGVMKNEDKMLVS